MKLAELLDTIYAGELSDQFQDLEIKSVCCDSRVAQADSLFVAVSGEDQDGARFIPEAIAKGAVVIVKNTGSLPHPDNVCTLEVEDTKKFLESALLKFYGNPSQKVGLIGITGTNGKTTVSYILESIFKAADKSCAVVGTVNYRAGAKILPAKNTTPGLVENHLFLTQLAEDNVEYCVMEVSSHALQQGRISLIDFRAAVFTNLTVDHLDYHGNMENYFNEKSKLFRGLSKNATAAINIDDEYGKKLLPLTEAKILSYSLETEADVTLKDLALKLSGTTFTLKTKENAIKIETSLIGRHNVYNILGAAVAAISCGIGLEYIQKGVKNTSGIPGRLENISCGQAFNVFVDYAHTDDALKNVLTSLKDIGSSRIITVFGCGGDRDTSKRAKMGSVASKLSDWSILTSDNPRSETPEAITEQIVSGFKGNNYEIVLDRKKAIAKAVSLAKAGDVVLIAGKGHEDYQIFADKTVHFDDREVVREVLNV